MTIKVYKIGQEEIIAKFVEIKGPYIVLSKPRVLQIMMQQNGQGGAALVPWFLTDPEAEMMVAISHIIASIDAPAEIEKMYLSQTSGIEIASAGSIIQ